MSETDPSKTKKINQIKTAAKNQDWQRYIELIEDGVKEGLIQKTYYDDNISKYKTKIRNIGINPRSYNEILPKFHKNQINKIKQKMRVQVKNKNWNRYIEIIEEGVKKGLIKKSLIIIIFLNFEMN